MFELMDSVSQSAVIKVIGVGGGGGNAVQHMVASGIEGVDFIAVNTDAQVLKKINARTTLQVGCNLTRGLGAGSNPEIGKQAALEDRDRIEEVLEGSDMVFITAGMGGGTGTGAAPIVAQVAKELDILVVAVVTKPFAYEGGKRMKVAEQGLMDLAQYVDSLIVIPNEKLGAVLGRDVPILQAFQAANEVLHGAVRGIADIITRPGLINLDFADVRTVMSEMGMAMMGTGAASGEGRARRATEAAVTSPLLENVNLQGARGILVNITAGMDLTMGEYTEVMEIAHGYAVEDASIKVGTVLDPSMSDEIRVTVVATGLSRPQTQAAPVAKPQVAAPPAAAPVMQVVAARTGTDDRPDWKRLERPAYARQQERGELDARDQEYLDIPAFLRRQAD
ncbi:MAG TPA: cell division protein FtsZ [Gammaproteobacteria bacterium]|nr:cell division protein FtsZ [Gammaproteobacteria bacterium]